MNLIIDTDPGHDDAFALMLAAGSSRADIGRVTTVGGNAELAKTTRNARHVLDLVDRDQVPVHPGNDQPLERELETAQVHGDSGLDGLDVPPAATPGTQDAVDRLLAAADAETTLVTLGPLTNVAAAIERDPGQMQQYSEIVCMGGAIEAAGNQNRVAEFNMYVDPEAAATVIESGLPTTLVPLGPCNGITIEKGDLHHLEESRLYDPLAAMIDAYIANISSHLGVDGALMYDPLAVFTALQPDTVESQPMDVRVETEGTLTRGMTVADQRQYTEKEPTTDVVTAIDGEQFRQTFLDALEAVA